MCIRKISRSFAIAILMAGLAACGGSSSNLDYPLARVSNDTFYPKDSSEPFTGTVINVPGEDYLSILDGVNNSLIPLASENLIVPVTLVDPTQVFCSVKVNKGKAEQVDCAYAGHSTTVLSFAVKNGMPADKLFHYDTAGNTVMVVPLEGGLPQGKVTIYYPNSKQSMVEAEYADGMREGDLTAFDVDGKRVRSALYKHDELIADEQYRDGKLYSKLDMETREYTYVDASGQTVFAQDVMEMGQDALRAQPMGDFEADWLAQMIRSEAFYGITGKEATATNFAENQKLVKDYLAERAAAEKQTIDAAYKEVKQLLIQRGLTDERADKYLDYCQQGINDCHLQETVAWNESSAVWKQKKQQLEDQLGFKINQ